MPLASKSRNPFLVREGFLIRIDSNLFKTFYQSRNPFLVREGFLIWIPEEVIFSPSVPPVAIPS